MIRSHQSIALRPGRGIEQLEGRLLFTIPGVTADNVWPNYTQATADLNTIHNAYPNITRLISLGKTASGTRDMWALEITDNPGVEEDEPEFLYNGQIHGDEPIGMKNSFMLIQYLLQNYNLTTGDGPRVTNLVDNMDLWFVPSQNWDGYMHNGGGIGNAWRYNNNGTDLNRNFPEWTNRSFDSGTKYFGPYGNMFDGPAPQTALLQAETVNMMNFRRARNFVASATFHSGDLVVNYEWDSNGNTGADYATSPDDTLMRDLALVYSTQNTPMYNNNSFPFVHGTTNGDNWYPISGGEQDWSYIYTGSTEFTIELNSSSKYPSATQLATMWNNNREAMIQYMQAANWGVRGIITDVNTGAPLFAKITVVSPAASPTPDANHPSTHPVFSDPDLGDYHRQLEPGTYTLKFEVPGYQTQTISGVVVSAKTNDPLATARLNVQMVPVDNTPPSVQSGAFAFDATPQQSIRFTFSEPVQNLDNTDLILSNASTSSVIPASDITLASYDAVTRTATFTFNTPGNTLPGGSYTASLNTGGVQDLAGNPLASGYSYRFVYAAGTSGNDTIFAAVGNASLLVWVNANPLTDSPTHTAVFSSLSNFSIDGFGGDDVLTLDFAGGDVRPAGTGAFGWRMGSSHETLHVNGATTWAFATDPASDAYQPNLSVQLTGGATATFAAPVTHLDALTIGAGSSAIVSAGGSRVLVLGGLTLTDSGQLDLNDNSAIVDYDGSSPLASVRDAIRLARNNGDWLGAGGLTSSAAKNNPLHNTTLGLMESADYLAMVSPSTSFAGQPIDASAVLVKYTYYGDANFDGRVTFDDYVKIDTGFAQHGTTWNNGDFNLDGVVNFDDYVLIDTAFNSQGAPLGRATSERISAPRRPASGNATSRA